MQRQRRRIFSKRRCFLVLIHKSLLRPFSPSPPLRRSQTVVEVNFWPTCIKVSLSISSAVRSLVVRWSVPHPRGIDRASVGTPRSLHPVRGLCELMGCRHNRLTMVFFEQRDSVDLNWSGKGCDEGRPSLSPSFKASLHTSGHPEGLRCLDNHLRSSSSAVSAEGAMRRAHVGSVAPSSIRPCPI